MRIIHLVAASVATIFLVFISSPAKAIGQCISHFGEPVPIFQDYNLPNVGMASRDGFGRPFIVVNPHVLNQFPYLAQRFWFYHECAHHALPPNMNNETNADCFAVRNMRDVGELRNLAAVQDMLGSISQLPGSAWGHLPGPSRARNMLNCIQW